MRFAIILTLMIGIPGWTIGQHEEHQHQQQRQDTSMMMPEDQELMPMSHAFSLHLPMQRNGSGTGWMPDSTPMYGMMLMHPKWMHMFHYNLFLRYNHQDIGNAGERGAEDMDIPSWLMLMGQRKIGKASLFHYSAMISFDPFLVGESGYPLLFQTGETYNQRPLVDRQHPHDLFSELSISIAHAFSNMADVFLYVGYPGEPALGPVAFMHRVSALDNPNSPLSHHWIDATHITFGVATLGLRYGSLKIETSLFTGREPDEDRYDFDEPKFDSWSSRLSLNPGPGWSLQLSHGFLKSPEVLHPEEDVYRTTASAIHTTRLNPSHSLNTTLAWGLNNTADVAQHALLAEAALRMNKLVIYGRYDFTQKSALELDLEDTFDEDVIFNIHALTAGINFDVLHSHLSVAPGLNFTFNMSDELLHPLYGEMPWSFQAYVRVYPGEVKMKEMSQHMH